MANRQSTSQSLGINDMPRNVIDNILERLPLTDAVKFSIASKKFRVFWLTLPYINIAFDAQLWKKVFLDENIDHLMFRDVVSGILLSHIGPVTKFRLCIPCEFSGGGPCISQWVSFLSGNGIKDLTIKSRSCYAGTGVPSALFSCVDLVKLSLCFFRFTPPPSFKGFQKLECLVLKNITFTSDKLGSLIANFPRLEVVSLVGYIGLKTITINAPKLKSLSISGSSFLSIFLSNVTNLVSLSITFSKSVDIFDKGTTRNMIKTLAKSCKLEKLNFGHLFWKVLDASGISNMLPTTFHFLRYLELSSINLSVRNRASCAVGIIRSCPNMEKLEISVSKYTDDVEHILDYYNHDIVLNHLRNARITCIKGLNTELKLIEYVFASSPILEEFTVELAGGLEATSIIAMAKELMRFPRASPRAKLIFKGS